MQGAKQSQNLLDKISRNYIFLSAVISQLSNPTISAKKHESFSEKNQEELKLYEEEVATLKTQIEDAEQKLNSYKDSGNQEDEAECVQFIKEYKQRLDKIECCRDWVFEQLAAKRSERWTAVEAKELQDQVNYERQKVIPFVDYLRMSIEELEKSEAKQLKIMEEANAALMPTSTKALKPIIVEDDAQGFLILLDEPQHSNSQVVPAESKSGVSHARSLSRSLSLSSGEWSNLSSIARVTLEEVDEPILSEEEGEVQAVAQPETPRPNAVSGLRRSQSFSSDEWMSFRFPGVFSTQDPMKNENQSPEDREASKVFSLKP